MILEFRSVSRLLFLEFVDDTGVLDRFVVQVSLRDGFVICVGFDGLDCKFDNLFELLFGFKIDANFDADNVFC